MFQKLWRHKAVRHNKHARRFIEQAARSAGYKGDLASEEEMRYEDYNNAEGMGNGIGQFTMQALGTDPAKALGETKKYIVKNTPELMKGGMAGALLGTVFPLGGPLFGALAGSAVSILSKNKSFTDYVFGTELKDGIFLLSS